MASREGVDPLRSTLRQIAAELESKGARYAVVGGLAVTLRAEPRLTRDIDLAVSVSGDREAENLIHALLARGYRVLTLLEHVPTGRLATVRLAPPGPQDSLPIVDLLFASCGIEPEVVAAAEPLEVAAGFAILVARAEELLAMKVLARDDRKRPADRDDILALLAVLDDAGIETARRWLERIAERGYGREKDLIAELGRAIEENRKPEGSFRPRTLPSAGE